MSLALSAVTSWQVCKAGPCSSLHLVNPVSVDGEKGVWQPAQRGQQALSAGQLDAQTGDIGCQHLEQLFRCSVCMAGSSSLLRKLKFLMQHMLYQCIAHQPGCVA